MLKISFQCFLKVFVVAFAISLLGGGLVRASQSSCGDDQMACGDEEKCCEHPIATFCANDGCSSVRVEGQCVAKEKSCDEFWCGNRQCQSNWLISKDVCCIYYPSDNSPQYSCSASELSCRGNNTQLTIRPPTVASRQLQDVN